MSKKKAVILLLLIVIATNGAQFVIQHMAKASKVAAINEELLVAERTLSDIGPMQVCWTTSAETYSGQKIKAENLEQISIPSSFVNDTFVLDNIALLDKYFKIAIKPGTPLTTDMVMDIPLDDTLREVDITGNRWPVGLKEGDFVDYRIVYPYGEDFIVLSHLRVEQITDQSLKVYMTEAEQHYYQAALVDYFLNRAKGADIYLNKYVEPGIQKEAETYYSIPKRVEAIMLLDPNITNKAEATINAELRQKIESVIDSVTQEDGGTLQAGRVEHNGKINNDYQVDKSDDGTGNGGKKPLKDPVASTADEPEDEVLITEGDTVE